MSKSSLSKVYPLVPAIYVSNQVIFSIPGALVSIKRAEDALVGGSDASTGRDAPDSPFLQDVRAGLDEEGRRHGRCEGSICTKVSETSNLRQ